MPKSNTQKKAEALARKLESEQKILDEATRIRKEIVETRKLNLLEKITLHRANLIQLEKEQDQLRDQLQNLEAGNVPTADELLRLVIDDAKCLIPNCATVLSFQTARILPASAVLQAAKKASREIPENKAFAVQISVLLPEDLRRAMCCPKCGLAIADVLAEKNPNPRDNNDVKTHHWRVFAENWASERSSFLSSERQGALDDLRDKLHGIQSRISRLREEKNGFEAKLAEKAEAEERTRNQARATLSSLGILSHAAA